MLIIMSETDAEKAARAARDLARVHRQREPDKEPYDAAFFAEKHGLTLKAAEVIIYANGPSRTMCDAAADAFLRAVAERRNRQGP